MTMPGWLTNALRWANLVVLVVILLLAGRMYVNALILDALNSYHRQYVQPFTGPRMPPALPSGPGGPLTPKP